MARERFDDAQHQVKIRGPEGHSVMRNKHKQVVRGDYTVEHDGFDEYMRELAKDGDFTLVTEKSQTQGAFVGGIAALNLLARVTGGEEITEDEITAAQAGAAEPNTAE